MKKSKIFISRKKLLEWSGRSEIDSGTSLGSQSVPMDHLRPSGKNSKLILKIDFPTSKSIFSSSATLRAVKCMKNRVFQHCDAPKIFPTTMLWDLQTSGNVDWDQIEKLTGQIFDLGLRNRDFSFLASPM